MILPAAPRFAVTSKGKSENRIPIFEFRAFFHVVRADVIAGRPGAARAVGNAMARNRLPLLIPCHRVIAADGSIGGFSAEIGIKRRLLEIEGALLS